MAVVSKDNKSFVPISCVPNRLHKQYHSEIMHDPHMLRENVDKIIPDNAGCDAEWIFYASWACVVSIMYAIRRSKYSLAVVPASVLITSVNFWRDPVPGLRQKLDYLVVNSGMIYQVLKSNELPKQRRHQYLMLVILAVAMLCVSAYSHFHGMCTPFVLSHVMLHILGNASNLILYHYL